MKLLATTIFAVTSVFFGNNSLAQQTLNLEFEQLEFSNAGSNITDIQITPSDQVLGCDEQLGLFLSENTTNNNEIQVHFLVNGNAQNCKYSIMSGCAFASLSTGEVLRVYDDNLVDQITANQSSAGRTHLALWESDVVKDSKDSIVFKSAIQKAGIDVSNGVVTKFNSSVNLFQPSLEIDLSTIRVYSGNQTLSLNTIDSTFQGDGTGKLISVSNTALAFDVEFNQAPPENATIFLEYGGRFNTGEEIELVSNNVKNNSSNFFFTHKLESNIELGDSIRVPDPFQSRLAIVNDEKIIVAVNPLNSLVSPMILSLDSNQIQGLPSTVIFSSNGEALFIGTTEGQILRISGITNLYDSSNIATVTYQSIYENSSHSISGLAIDPNDENRLMASMINSSGTGTVGLFFNALSQAEFLDVSGDLPSLDVLDCELDMNNPNIAFIGTSSGIWAASNLDNSQVNWSQQASDMINDTVIEVTQQTQSSEISSRTIFALTSNAGIWKSQSLVGIIEEGRNIDPLITVYPNPANEVLYVQLNDEQAGADVSIMSMDGKMVWKNNIPSNSGLLTVPIARLSPGVYILQAIKGVRSETTKFIVR